MTFTPEPPTTPGFFAWKPFSEYQGVFEVYHIENQDDCAYAERRNGLWCRLVPVEEVKKAYLECFANRIWSDIEDENDTVWDRSRAKRVMEGKE